jgi:hypothetical protein
MKKYSAEYTDTSIGKVQYRSVLTLSACVCMCCTEYCLLSVSFHLLSVDSHWVSITYELLQPPYEDNAIEHLRFFVTA